MQKPIILESSWKCASFDLQLLITPLGSSNFSYKVQISTYYQKIIFKLFVLSVDGLVWFLVFNATFSNSLQDQQKGRARVAQ
jgi:hypothetical protein